MLKKSLPITIILALNFFACTPSFAASVPLAQLANNDQRDLALLQKVSFWGLPYPYGYAWNPYPCYVWHSVLTRHGHRRWYRVRVSDDSCRL